MTTSTACGTKTQLSDAFAMLDTLGLIALCVSASTESIRCTSTMLPLLVTRPGHLQSSMPTTWQALTLCDFSTCTARTGTPRSEEHKSELQSLMRNSYAVFCLKQ